jgi:U3 small nucleolar ribonucleoprotein protein IMP3
MPKLRTLKYHEQKLLKKVDFLNWESDGKNKDYILKMINLFQLKDQTEYFK